MWCTPTALTDPNFSITNTAACLCSLFNIILSDINWPLTLATHLHDASLILSFSHSILGHPVRSSSDEPVINVHSPNYVLIPYPSYLHAQGTLFCIVQTLYPRNIRLVRSQGQYRRGSNVQESCSWMKSKNIGLGQLSAGSSYTTWRASSLT